MDKKGKPVERWTDFISTLAVTQLITSWAITISDINTYPKSLCDPHAVLGIYLALLAWVSLTMPLWSGVLDDNPRAMLLCQILNLIQNIIFLGSIFGRAYGGSETLVPRWT